MMAIILRHEPLLKNKERSHLKIMRMGKKNRMKTMRTMTTKMKINMTIPSKMSQSQRLPYKIRKLTATLATSRKLN